MTNNDWDNFEEQINKTTRNTKKQQEHIREQHII